ncbi:MAG: hypothetical protein INR63_27155 [Actinomycetospora chiangmaiensis]|nr:hypothetical protein [Actinomycetospora chiangmaiensis]
MFTKTARIRWATALAFGGFAVAGPAVAAPLSRDAGLQQGSDITTVQYGYGHRHGGWGHHHGFGPRHHHHGWGRGHHHGWRHHGFGPRHHHHHGGWGHRHGHGRW